MNSASLEGCKRKGNNYIVAAKRTRERKNKKAQNIVRKLCGIHCASEIDLLKPFMSTR